jgi:hypothetical protein
MRFFGSYQDLMEIKSQVQELFNFAASLLKAKDHS